MQKVWTIRIICTISNVHIVQNLTSNIFSLYFTKYGTWQFLKTQNILQFVVNNISWFLQVPHYILHIFHLLTIKIDEDKIYHYWYHTYFTYCTSAEGFNNITPITKLIIFHKIFLNFVSKMFCEILCSVFTKMVALQFFWFAASIEHSHYYNAHYHQPKSVLTDSLLNLYSLQVNLWTFIQFPTLPSPCAASPNEAGGSLASAGEPGAESW